MISEVQLENFKSINSLTFLPGQVTVLIGENGSGKSNILEGIGFGVATASDRLSDDLLFSRGIRVTEVDWMMGKMKNAGVAFKAKGAQSESITNVVAMRAPKGESLAHQWIIAQSSDKSELQSLRTELGESFSDLFTKAKAEWLESSPDSATDPDFEKLFESYVLMDLRRQRLDSTPNGRALKDYLIFAPENSVLRRFDDEGAIRPLGTKGEGLLKHLQFLASNPEFAKDLKHHLQLLGWFSDLELPTEADEMRGRLRIRDRWLSEDAPVFDQRSANEGFLYLLFYFTLMMSKHTPKFFAIDNIDNALNPKLCAELMRQLAVLAAKHGKQVICTTHNPAILDGLNLNDDMQRLYVVRRDSEGHTVVNRVNAPRPRPDGKSIRLSTAFMEGMLGGLPDHF